MKLFLTLVALYSILFVELPRSRAFPVGVEAFKGTFDDLHPGRSNLMRRSVKGYNGPGPSEYLDSLREQLQSQEGNDSIAVFGVFDQDVVEGNYKPLPKNGKCRLTQSFRFPLESLLTQFETSALTGVTLLLRDVILRAYVETIPRHLPEPGDNLTVVVDVLENIVQADNSSVQPEVLAASENITVTSDTEEYRWLEKNITEGAKSLILSTQPSLLVKFHFNLQVCAHKYRKVPLKVVDPANVPLEDEERRENYQAVQPMVIFIFDVIH